MIGGWNDLPAAEEMKSSNPATRQFADLLHKAQQQRRAGLVKEAIAGFSELLLKVRERNNEKKEAEFFMALGSLFWDNGEMAKSSDSFARALEISRKNNWNEIREICETALNISRLYQRGKLCRDKAQYALSEKCFQKAIALAKRIRSVGHEVKCLRQLSITHYCEMKLDKYYHLNKRAHELSAKHRLLREKANTAFNLAFYHLKTGGYYAAFLGFHDALAVFRQLEASDDVADCLHNIALIYYEMGNYEYSLRSLRRLYDETENEELKTALLISMGNAAKKIALQGEGRADLTRAVSYYRKALDRAHKAQNRFYETVILNNLGYYYFQLKNYPLALRYFKLGKKVAQGVADVNLRCTVLANLGNAYLGLGQHALAKKHYFQAIGSLNRKNHHQILWEVFYGLARCSQFTGESRRAMSQYFQSIRAIHETAGIIESDADRSNYLFDKYGVYEAAMSLLVEGRPPESLDRQAKRELILLIESYQSQKLRDGIFFGESSMRGGEPFDSISQAWDRLRPSGGSGKTAVLVYFFGESLCFFALLKGDTIEFFRLPKRERIEPAVKTYLKLLSSRPHKRFQEMRAAQKLGRDLFVPDHEKKLEGIENIVIIPDGILCYLPFESLVIEDHKASRLRFVVEKYGVSYALSLASANLQSRRTDFPKNEGKTLVVGKSRYDEYSSPAENEYLDSLRRAGSLMEISLSDLQNVRREAMSVVACAGRGNTTLWLDDMAEEEAAKTNNLLPYRIMHWACHGLFDENFPMRSALVLTRKRGSSEDGYLQMSEIRNLRLDAELVVLSACQTGKGKLSRGEGIMGLSKAFFQAGARSVVSTLWNVHDASTAVYMKHFYGNLSRGMTKTEALRHAKLKMIESDFSHPYYWAPFVLSGDFASACKLN